MKRVLKNLLTLALVLFVSTAAATLLKELWRAARWAAQVSAFPASHPSHREVMPDAPVGIYYQPIAPLTPQAVRDQVNGVVKLRMILNRDGTVSGITPIQTLPDGLTEQAIEAARGIKFLPAVVGGQLVDTEQVVEFQFVCCE